MLEFELSHSIGLDESAHDARSWDGNSRRRTQGTAGEGPGEGKGSEESVGWWRGGGKGEGSGGQRVSSFGVSLLVGFVACAGDTASTSLHDGLRLLWQTE